MPIPKPFPRLIEIDALRGLAAITVVLFHYTTRYDQLFSHGAPPLLTFSWGHYGVNLFFMISGFVIFMTLDRIKTAGDFIVSRFSRLFPAYWAAVILTFALTHALNLPGKTVDVATAGANFLMFHGFFGIAHVDSVYWTLEIELIFYAWALLLYVRGWMGQIHGVLAALLGLKLIYFLCAKLWGIDLPYRIGHFLILDYISWFAIGIMIYRLTRADSSTCSLDVSIVVAAILVIGITKGWHIGFLAVGLSALMFGAATRRITVLSNPVLVWFGTISYCLYLLHENIGWGVIRLLELRGTTSTVAIVAATSVCICLAAMVTYLVEKPSLARIRDWHKRRSTGSETIAATK